MSLPPPDAESLAAAEALTARALEAIDAAGGFLPFERYMDLVLYAPGLGYYARGAVRFGADGDFTTAPELSPLFSRACARQAAQVLRATGGSMLELGAGSGRLACDALAELARLDALPARYLILEPSAALRARQQALFAGLDPELAGRMEWIDALPESFDGFLIANEVLDALPVHLLVRRGGTVLERGVVRAGDRLAWAEHPAQGELADLAGERLPPLDGYTSEISLAAPAMVRDIAARLRRGVALFLDYGFPRAEFFHPQRSMGTLLCHYRHRVHDDPLWLPGGQDITAHVDFTGIAEAALDSGLEVLGYAAQAWFLVNCGITDLLAETPAEQSARFLPQAGAVEKLLSPAEMGELVKAVALGRDFEQPLLGFARRDRSAALIPPHDADPAR